MNVEHSPCQIIHWKEEKAKKSVELSTHFNHNGMKLEVVSKEIYENKNLSKLNSVTMCKRRN